MQLTAEQRHRVVYELGLTTDGIKDLAVICGHCRTPREVDGVIDGIQRTLKWRPSTQIRQLTKAEVAARKQLPFSDAEIRSAVTEGIRGSVTDALNAITGRV